MLFFSMLVMYSAFVLTSVDTEYYVQDIAKIYEYYVYFWGVGDLIEELISCFVRVIISLKNLENFIYCLYFILVTSRLKSLNAYLI